MPPHTALIDRLRVFPGPTREAAADAIEALEQQVAAQQAQMYADRRQALVWRDQVAALTKERDAWREESNISKASNDMLKGQLEHKYDQLAAAQDDNARLRGVLKTIDETYEEGVKPGPLLATYCSTVAHAALALPTDDSALQERLKHERERVAQMIMNGSFLHTEAPVAIWAREVAAAIRSMT